MIFSVFLFTKRIRWDTISHGQWFAMYPIINRKGMKNISFGKKLRFIRRMRDLTQEKLGKRAGITRVTISKYERDLIKPGLNHIKALATALNVSIDELTN